MGNRKHRYLQRSYKYQEQERVPEYFEEYHEYDYYDYDYFSDCSTCGGRWSEWSESVDSACSVDENVSDDDGGKVKTMTNQVHKNTLSSVVEVQNRYAILDDDEKEVTISILDKDEQEDDTSNDQILEYDQSEWTVYHCKSAKRRIRKVEKEIAASIKNMPPAPDETVVALQKLEIQKWVDSWRKKHDSNEKSTNGSVSDEDGFWIVNIEGFFREKRKAGYGVIIRDRYGVPLVASSGVYDQGEPISELYHELQGFNRGLELAIMYGLRKLYLHCTVYKASHVIQSSCRLNGTPGDHVMRGCYCQDRFHNLVLNIVCKKCIDSHHDLHYHGGIELLYPLIQEIVHKCSMFRDSPKFGYDCTGRRYNVAADYLSKLPVNQEEMNPDEFPEELKEILYKDAHNPKMMYLNRTVNGVPEIVTMESSTCFSCSSLTDLITEDILILIFTHLPLSSIYKLRCVSKVWLSILSNPNFIAECFRFHTMNKTIPWIQFHTVGYYYEPRKLINFRYAYPPDLHSQFISRYEHGFSFRFLGSIPVKEHLYLIGSSNGLVLCYSVSSVNQVTYYVCNPLTQQWVSLPPPPDPDRSQLGVNGFLCEYSSSNMCTSCCYKVVRIVKFGKKFSVEIFSSDLGEWRKREVSCAKNVVRSIPSYDHFVTLNGVLFWIEDKNRILTYNLNHSNVADGHQCRLINLPDEELDDPYVEYGNRILGESEGCICYARIRIQRGEFTLSVWKLVEETWHLLHDDVVLPIILVETDSEVGSTNRLQVLGFNPIDRNDVLLGYKHQVWAYNILSRRFEELRYPSFLADGERGLMVVPFLLKPMPTILPPPSWIDT